MSLVVYGHPFSSYTQKVLIALHENGTPFAFRCISPAHPDHVADWSRRWPLRKFPVLLDGDREVVETSVIIEYLQLAHPGPARFLPDDAMAALDVRFMDRFFDLHVMDAAQCAVDGALTGDPVRARNGMARSEARLGRAYAWLETRLGAGGWACGEHFGLADCAAAPALFYADWVLRIPEDCARLRAYRARLLARPAVARCVEEARPYRPLFPLGAPDRD